MTDLTPDNHILTEIYEKVGIVVVLYFPTEKQIAKLNRLSRFKHVFVVDNTPGFSERRFPNSNITYLPQYINIGIATALNIGIRGAMRDGCEYVNLYDQDSDYSEILVIKLYKAFKKAKKSFLKVALVAPKVAVINSSLGVTANNTKTDPLKPVHQVMTSGSLIDIQSLKKIGMMEDDLFIDLVDTEWCFRARWYNYNIIEYQDALMEHNLGIKTIIKGGISLTISTPVRYFYRYRNFFKIILRNYFPLKFKIKGVYARLIGFYYFVRYSEKPYESFKWILKGICSGLGIYNFDPNKK